MSSLLTPNPFRSAPLLSFPPKLESFYSVSQALGETGSIGKNVYSVHGQKVRGDATWEEFRWGGEQGGGKMKLTDGNEMEDEARRLLSCAVEAEGIDDDGGGEGGGGECDGDDGGGN